MKNIDLPATKATLKSGNEKLSFNEENIGYSLLDFWQWSASDILSNSTRGKFAEFIVGSSLNLKIDNLRDEWDAFDLSTEDGIKIEVKSSAYIQSWKQIGFSSISFSIKPAKHWDPNTGIFSDESSRHADLYVFCLLKHKEQDSINPLKMEQWEFYVVPTFILNNLKANQSSIGLNSLKKISEKVDYLNLKKEIYSSFTSQKEFIK